LTTKVLLIGMMGAGKTTVGEALSARLGWKHLDSDAQVQATTGRTIPEIFATDGEAAFRAEESKALAEAVAGEKPAVISVAGGAVLDTANRELLRRSGPVVWLRADPGTLATRVGSGAGRPLLDADPKGNLRRLYETRRPVYEALADLTIDVDDLDPGQVASRIIDWLHAEATQR
jgi:shikimate kinase